MPKITLNNLSNLQNESSAVNIINNNNDVLEAAVENTISRDGTAPNTMGAELDMNGNRILNLPVPVSQTEPVRLVDLDSVILAEGGGNVTGPVASGTGNIAIFLGSSGKVIADGNTTIGDIESEIDTKAPIIDAALTGDTSVENLEVLNTSPSILLKRSSDNKSKKISVDSDNKFVVRNQADTTNIITVTDTGTVSAVNYLGDGTSLTGVELAAHSSATYSPITRTISFKTAPYTLALSDSGNVVCLDSASTVSITIPTNASVAFPVGTQIDLIVISGGFMQVVAASGAAVYSPTGVFKIPNAGAATLIKFATNGWLLNGTLVP